MKPLPGPQIDELTRCLRAMPAEDLYVVAQVIYALEARSSLRRHAAQVEEAHGREGSVPLVPDPLTGSPPGVPTTFKGVVAAMSPEQRAVLAGALSLPPPTDDQCPVCSSKVGDRVEILPLPRSDPRHRLSGLVGRVVAQAPHLEWSVRVAGEVHVFSDAELRSYA